MTLERRDFIRLGSAGITASILSAQSLFAQSTGEFEGGTGSVHLEAKLKSGTLKVDVQDFIDGTERTLIGQGVFDSQPIYNAIFSYNRDLTVFALFRNGDHSTTLVLSGTETSEIGRLIVWHDVAATQTFRVSKINFLQKRDAKDVIVDEKGNPIDLTGYRKPPTFSAQELETVFSKNAALLKFMRGSRSLHDPSPEYKLQAWACDLTRFVPGSFVGVLWAAIGS